MFKNILIPSDGSELAGKAIEHGNRFAREVGTKVVAVTVTEPFHLLSVAPSQIEYTCSKNAKHANAHAAKVLGAVSAAAERNGVACETMRAEHEHVYQAIIEAAVSKGCDLIAIASHGGMASRPSSSGARRSRCSPIRKSPSSSIADPLVTLLLNAGVGLWQEFKGRHCNRKGIAYRFFDHAGGQQAAYLARVEGRLNSHAPPAGGRL